MDAGSEVQSRPKRPRSVTVIGWISFWLGWLALLVQLFARSPDHEAWAARFRSEHAYQYGFLLFNLALMVVCGVFMLQGRNWARWVFAVWFGQNVIRNAIANPRYVLGVLVFGTAVFFLFRGPASSFFNHRKNAGQRIPDIKI